MIYFCSMDDNATPATPEPVPEIRPGVNVIKLFFSSLMFLQKASSNSSSRASSLD
jgi:hypothetical protein